MVSDNTKIGTGLLFLVSAQLCCDHTPFTTRRIAAKIMFVCAFELIGVLFMYLVLFSSLFFDTMNILAL